VLLSGY